MVKKCTKCKKEFPATTEWFYKKERGKYGLDGQCKLCICARTKEYRDNNNELIKKHKKEIYHNNRENDLQRSKYYRENNKKKVAQHAREYRQENKEVIAQRKRQYYENNKDKILQRCKLYRNNKEKNLQYNREWVKKRCRIDLMFKLNRVVSSAIYKSIVGKKNGKHWESLVNYTLEQLMQHLENQFQIGMTWKNHSRYGWHIDHKKPIASFYYNSPDDEEFKQCWSLENLQPLWAEDNLKKSAKW